MQFRCQGRQARHRWPARRQGRLDRLRPRHAGGAQDHAKGSGHLVFAALGRQCEQRKVMPIRFRFIGAHQFNLIIVGGNRRKLTDGQA